MRGFLMIAALLLGLAIPARAEMPLPSDYLTEEDLRGFARCRAASFYHISLTPAPGQTVPASVARALLDQINFVMSETISAKVPENIATAQELLSFTEHFILLFSRVLREDEAELSDVARREAVLLNCIPTMWAITRGTIDDMVAARAAWMMKPVFVDPELANPRRRALLERFFEAD